MSPKIDFTTFSPQCVTSGQMKLTATVAGTYLAIGYVNTNSEGLKSIQLYQGSTEKGSIALSDVGQYHWRGATIAQILTLSANTEVSMRQDGTLATAPAAGRAGLCLIRVA